MTIVGIRWMLWTASGLVLAIGLLLYVFPKETDALFSWTVNPPMTASFLGAAYLASCALEFLSARERIWARARPAVPAVFVFTALTLAVTLLHIDKFHLGSDFSLFTQVVTWVWIAVYAIVPVVMAVLIVLQARAADPDPPRVAPLPVWLKRSLAGLGLGVGVVGIALLASPTAVASAVWPWPLSALTGRAIGAWLVGTGISAVHSAWEDDLARLHPALLSYVLLALLQLVAVALFAGSTHPITGVPVFDWSSPTAWGFVAITAVFGAISLSGWRSARSVVRRTT
jgi:hypothetical protein